MFGNLKIMLVHVLNYKLTVNNVSESFLSIYLF